jgi:hypothetical protein
MTTSFDARPDDIEIGCGGTEYKLIQQGFEVTHIKRLISTKNASLKWSLFEKTRIIQILQSLTL